MAEATKAVIKIKNKVPYRKQGILKPKFTLHMPLNHEKNNKHNSYPSL